MMEAIPGFICFAVTGILSLAATVFWMWMLIEVLTKEPSEGNEKIIWVLVIIFTTVIGALIYFVVRRPERMRTFGE